MIAFVVKVKVSFNGG